VHWPIFDGVPDAEMQRVLSIARRRTFARGEVVFHHDDPADTVHLIVSGRFAVRVRTPVGDSAILTVLGPGELFGEVALLGPEQRRSATVEALEAAETRSIFRDDFHALRASHPGVSDVLIAILVGEVTRLSRHLLEALYVSSDKRVLRRLIELADLYGGADAAEVTIPLRQDDLAGLAGTSRATVNRVLRQEEARGTVGLERGKVTVRDRAALERRGR
jgi:CRP/FNR family transcriptional regulator, cyclic AMP receptor protein